MNAMPQPAPKPTQPPTGLPNSLVLRRQDEEGFNELPTSRPRPIRHIVLGIVREPMAYLLLGCGLIYFLVGDRPEATMLLGFLLLIIGIEIIQERKAERALEALRDLSSPRALVLRDGIKQRIPGREVVREDLIFVGEGDRVPADATLIAGSQIAADESLLTGESLPVEKSPGSRLYAATTLVRGQGTALVTAIGLSSEVGKIGKSLQAAPLERTRLESEADALVRRLAWMAGAICVLVFLVYAVTRGAWLQGFLVGLTLAMAILPNELPAVLTIFLALGAWRIAQRRVLTRRLPAVENLGSTTVLCVDKTGTLTLNQMRIQKLYSQGNAIDLLESGTKFLPEEFHEVLEFGILASRQDPFDPMELAFSAAGMAFLRGTEHLHHDWSLAREYPLSPELLAISHAWKPITGGGYVIGAKGAPEAIVDLCHMPPEEAQATLARTAALAREGLRVLGVAKATTPSRPLPSHQHAFDFQFLGLVGIADPIRPEVPGAIRECHSAGVRVVMLTGDHPVTASSIARRIGLRNPESVVTGAEIENQEENELAAKVRDSSVFSRVSPAQKLRLVNALKANGEIVAMTGDGVNDAPALKSAHIGIAMGARGTDVARESASLVLLDDDFGSIVEAIRMGRRVYANLQGALGYLLAVHVPIAGMSILPVFLKMPLVLLPAHIALLHLIIEPASSIAFEVDPASPTIMENPPRNPREPLFARKLLLLPLLRGSCVLAALLGVYVIALLRNQGEADARALVFATLIISNAVLIFLSRKKEAGAIPRSKNPVAAWLCLASLGFLAAAIYLPAARELFRFSYLHVADWLVCLLIGISSPCLLEILRKPWNKGGKENERKFDLLERA
jgi:Ca2+-transporting ATPase